MASLPSSDAFESAIAAFRGLMLTMRREQPAWLDVDLTMAQTKVLMLICTQGEVHGRGLAQVLGIGQPAVSKLVDHLVERGYVRRSEDQEDRRITWLRPTEAGQALYEHMTLIHRELLRAIFEELTPREMEIVCEAWSILARTAERLGKERKTSTSHEEVEKA